MEMDKAPFADDHILSGPSPVYDPNIMTLRAEDGRNVDFEFPGLIEYEGASYVRVGSGRILNAIFRLFKEKFRDQYHFTDEG